MICGDHGPDCVWYRHCSDRVGIDLGFGDGWRSGRDFAACHTPTANLPVGDCRGDLFALGFFDGITARWCLRHLWGEMQATGNRCLATYTCRKALSDSIQRSATLTL